MRCCSKKVDLCGRHLLEILKMVPKIDTLVVSHLRQLNARHREISCHIERFQFKAEKE